MSATWRDFALLQSGKNRNHLTEFTVTVSQAQKIFYMYPISSIKVSCGKHVEKLLNSICNELTLRANGYR